MKAYPHSFGRKGSRVDNVVAILLSIKIERWDILPCFYPIVKCDFRVFWRRGRKNAGVVLGRLLRSEVAGNFWMSLEFHHPCGQV